jgi:hypothetical protein
MFNLRRFCFAERGLFLVPAEHLGADGCSAEYVDAHASARPERAANERAMLDATLLRYFARTSALTSRAPDSWMPPRRANLAVITDPARVRPYTPPFLGTSWILYESDLDPERSHPEFATFQLVYFERLALLGSVRAALLMSLSYWLDRSDDEAQSFARAASRATRPDARAFVALARALPWIREVFHSPLREPGSVPPETLLHVEGANLLVPRALQPELVALIREFDAASREADAAFVGRSKTAPSASSASNAAIDSLCQWLADSAPSVVLAEKGGAALWSPDAPKDAARLRAALAGLEPDAAESLREDLATVSRVTHKIEKALGDQPLVEVSHEVEEGGAVYVRPDLRRVVYELEQSAFDARLDVAPPFHRALLAARVAHEWGHLSHESGIVCVPNARRDEHDDAVSVLIDRYVDVVRALPARVEEEARRELDAMGAHRGRPRSWGEALASTTLARIGDYAANAFARRFCEPEELEAYVRVNVRHHLNEGVGPLGQLVRHAIEVQYLAIGSDQRRLEYFFSTSWFVPVFVESGVFAAPLVEAVFAATAAVCDCYEVRASVDPPDPIGVK